MLDLFYSSNQNDIWGCSTIKFVLTFAFIISYNFIQINNVLAAEPPTKIITTHFISHCIANLPRTEKVAAIAVIKGWKPLSPKMKSVLGPAARNAKWQGWLHNDRKITIVTAISEGPSGDGRTKLKLCSTASPRSGNSLLAAEIINNNHSGLRLVRRATIAGHNVVEYLGKLRGAELFISIKGLADGSPGLTLSAGSVDY